MIEQLAPATRRPKPPFWLSSWSRGTDRDGKIVHHVTVALSRDTRHKQKVIVAVPDDELRDIPELERRKLLAKYICAALVELGIPNVP